MGLAMGRLNWQDHLNRMRMLVLPCLPPAPRRMTGWEALDGSTSCSLIFLSIKQWWGSKGCHGVSQGLSGLLQWDLLWEYSGLQQAIIIVLDSTDSHMHYMHMHLHVYVLECMWTHVGIWIQVSTWVGICVCIHVWACAWVQVPCELGNMWLSV